MDMAAEALISIIVPVYNAERFLPETIACVQKQTYENWELLLVDDCSTDGSRQLILDKAADDRRIRLVCQEQNQGAATARNCGVERAEGRYICYLDADDVWIPEKLQLEYEFMKKNQAAFIFSGYEFADENAKGLGKIVQVPPTITYEEALKNTTIFTSTVMFDTTKITKNLIQMPKVKSEDTATWWRILKTGIVAYGLNENLVKYRRSGNTLSSNKIEAIRRIWYLYRKVEKLSVIKSFWCLINWAFGAVLRRI